MFDVVLDLKNLLKPALTGLPSGQKVWVRIRACNARGKSNWSDPACKRVP